MKTGFFTCFQPIQVPLQMSTSVAKLDDSGIRRRLVPVTDDPVEIELDDQVKKPVSSTWFWKLESILTPIIITLLSLHIRFKDIGINDNVVWDEAHFGKFGSFYLKHTFYHDVHPVLGKMLIALSGYLVGYDGGFGFESGRKYPLELNYVGMRKLNCLFSVFTPTFAYLTAKSLDLNWFTTIFISLLCVYETSFVALSKFILLDSMLLFFTATTFYTLVKFNKINRILGSEFGFQWFKWLILSGISIGCVCSVKWVGVFVTVLYGVYVILDLLIKYYDTKLSTTKYLAHWFSRITTLIVIPFLIYMLCFYIHFKLLHKMGEGVKSTPSLLQINLDDHDIDLGPRDVYYGSKISIRSQGLSPNLLHSHGHNYPEGSGQQQVTTYGFKDDNNNFIVHYPWRGRGSQKIDSSTYEDIVDIRTVKDGDVIRLNHEFTQANLHSHDLPALLTKSAYEVTGYGNLNIGDFKDEWVVEIVEQMHSANLTYESLYESSPDFDSILHPISTSFRLKHRILGCYLATSGLAYPKWGFQQGEVICKSSWSSRDKSTWWNVEDHWNSNKAVPQIPDEYQPPKTKFWRDFILINFAMALSNNALIPDPDKSDSLASLPWEWPLAHVGLRMCTWSNSGIRYFLISLPFTTWTSTLSIAIFALLTLVKILQYQRQSLVWSEKQFWFYFMGGVIPFISWILHYFPFVMMSRVTYVHHYEPLLYFAIFVEGFLLDYLTQSKLKNWRVSALKFLVYSSMIGGVVSCFWYFSPFCLGMVGRKSLFEYLLWLPSWKLI